jgi:histidine triad (HIT) family protein
LDCVFCKIANGEIPTNKVYEDDQIIAFKDLDPQAPVHILLIPKQHIDSLNKIDEKTSSVISHIFMVASSLAKKYGIAEDGYRIVNNCGVNGGQTVMHLHFHLLGGRSMKWPPG